MNYLRRVVGRVLALPQEVRDSLQEQVKKDACTVGEDVRFLPTSRVENHQGTRSSIVIGAHCRILGHLIVLAHGGSIDIGESCFVGENSRIWSAERIKIGDRVLISHGVNIHDNNSHSLTPALRYEHVRQIFTTGHPKVLEDVLSDQIIIEEDAWIGFNSTILKGVTIGKGAIVGASTLVTKDVPSYTVVAGNPARVIRRIKL